MARATWSGAISFGLVSVPVALFTAVRSHDIHFRQLHEGTHARVLRKRVDAETGDEVPNDEIVKGYEVGDDAGRASGDDGYVIVDPDELEALDPEASRSIEIHDYVDLDDIDPIYYDRAYYLVPDGESARKPYHLLATAMERSGRVAVATFVMRTKEHLAALRARDGLLLLSTMHYADEVADPADLAPPGDDVEVSERELKMAEQLIESLVTDFDPEVYRDEQHQRVIEFLESRAEGEHVELSPPERESGGVIDLVAALEQSLSDAEETGPRSQSGRGGRGTDDDDGQLEQLSKTELYDRAQSLELPGRSSMSKDELVAALRDAEDPRAGAA